MRLAALALALLLATPAAAQDLIASYTAYIGHADLHNSNGQRLREPWQILRQDRANFHRFGIRQFADEYDPVFASMQSRAQMESLLRQGTITPEARRAILRGDLIVHVQVWGMGNRLHSIRVQTERF
jgi:hypothetical protein